MIPSLPDQRAIDRELRCCRKIKHDLIFPRSEIDDSVKVAWAKEKAVGSRTADQHVEPSAPIQSIIPTVSPELVTTVSTIKFVIAADSAVISGRSVSRQEVVAGTAIEDVVVSTSGYPVVVGLAIQTIVAFAAVETIIAVTARKDICMFSAK